MAAAAGEISAWVMQAEYSGIPHTSKGQIVMATIPLARFGLSPPQGPD
jgi:hypothetical protein